MENLIAVISRNGVETWALFDVLCNSLSFWRNFFVESPLCLRDHLWNKFDLESPLVEFLQIYNEEPSTGQFLELICWGEPSSGQFSEQIYFEEPFHGTILGTNLIWRALYETILEQICCRELSVGHF